MRNRVFLIAAALVAATSAPAFSNELVIGDTTMIVYEQSYNAPDSAYGENYVSGAEIVYLDEGTMVEADATLATDDQLIYAAEIVEPVYEVDSMADTQEAVTMTETIDGIVYETVVVPQTY